MVSTPVSPRLKTKALLAVVSVSVSVAALVAVAEFIVASVEAGASWV
ncbi:hypothetical protein BBROOKSOX_796 [Bathymodiolus brooksi thiotrophic gill symbiont]|nr:hypothetical protein BBROOKSOX_796 [Bathymodiolus brooksi thiotrophic gill symbiont]